MRISCPGCQTEYEVPDAALAGRTRKMRCANCSEQWSVSGPAVAPLAPEPVWPPASRSVYDDMPKVSERPAYEPLEAASLGGWPAPVGGRLTDEPKPERNPFVYDGPSSTAEILASLARSPATDPDEPDAEKSGQAEDGREGSIRGNEERFAALVKSSRSSDGKDDLRSGRSGIFTTFILLVFIFGGLWIGRDQVMHSVPATVPFYHGLYNVLGVHPAPPPVPVPAAAPAPKPATVPAMAPATAPATTPKT